MENLNIKIKKGTNSLLFTEQNENGSEWIIGFLNGRKREKLFLTRECQLINRRNDGTGKSPDGGIFLYSCNFKFETVKIKRLKN